jgi:hypothetical protein
MVMKGAVALLGCLKVWGRRACCGGRTAVGSVAVSAGKYRYSICRRYVAHGAPLRSRHLTAQRMPNAMFCNQLIFRQLAEGGGKLRL